MMNINGYINATKLCADAITKNGTIKPFRNRKENAGSHDLINEIATRGRIHVSVKCLDRKLLFY
jgi:hypothetical protein